MSLPFYGVPTGVSERPQGLGLRLGGRARSTGGGVSAAGRGFLGCDRGRFYRDLINVAIKGGRPECVKGGLYSGGRDMERGRKWKWSGRRTARSGNRTGPRCSPSCFWTVR
ncbi:hypothetical protein GCM10010399_37700 [Dactylosporangium fulvum]